MKKVLFTLVAMIFCASVFAQRTPAPDGYYNQKGAMAVGASLNYGSEIESLGIGIKYNWMMSNYFRLAPNATFWFKNDDLSSWDINVDVHYLIPLAPRWRLYPLAGLTLSTWKYDSPLGSDYDNTDTNFGVNLGAGAEVDITSRWALNLEVKYRIISDYDQAVIGLGFAYKF